MRFQIFIGFKNSAENFLSFELFFFATFTTKHAISVPDIDKHFDIDVALIELPKRKSFDFDPELNVNSICLPNNIDKVNEEMTMAGFGDINPKEETPEKLQYADKGIGISKF